MGSGQRVERQSSRRFPTAVRRVLVSTVLAWAAAAAIALFFGVNGYPQHLGFGALIVGAVVLAAGLFGREPMYRYARVASFGWLPGRDTSAPPPDEGLTALGVALFVVPPLFVIGAVLAG
jgi:hypothetical protein